MGVAVHVVGVAVRHQFCLGLWGLVSVRDVGTCRVVIFVIVVVVDEVDVRWGYGKGGAHKRGRMQAGVGIDCKCVR
jgi:hypothetical protein